MAKTSPAVFFRQVRQEVSKVTWPGRKEMMVTTSMVFIFVALAAMFFLLVDFGISSLIKIIFGIGI
jgi:preprotein translocase subunit SecE